ncbi:MAG TPA: phytanoyl-CoA dioxygenase family protein [Chitinophagales bacterium]|nr:phytanoyl-CoA dioxygenase family protein [Chitinophagales bacterium]
MRKMFIDATLQSEFEKKGYAVVPFLNNQQVKELSDFYIKENKLIDNYDPTFAEFSVLNAELENRKKIFEKITSVFLPVAGKILYNCRPLIANYVCKEPQKGLVPVHQNWAVVDETQYASVSIWCPLVDTNKTNGTLAFVDGSHRCFRGPRGSYANRSFLLIDEYIINNCLTYVNMKAGDAIILDDSIVHYSSPNYSNSIRLAIQLIMIPDEAPAYHYTFREENQKMIADLYEVDHNYYLTMVNWRGDLSKYTRLASFEFENKLYSEKEFKERMQAASAF